MNAILILSVSPGDEDRTLVPRKTVFEGDRRRRKSWGAHAPSRVVSDAPVGNCVEWLGRPVFGEGAKDNTRWRVCSPWNAPQPHRIRYFELYATLVTYIVRTTSVRGTAYEVLHHAHGMKPSAFDAQNNDKGKAPKGRKEVPEHSATAGTRS